MIFYTSTIPTTKWLLKRCYKKCIWQTLFPKLENSWRRVARISLRGLGVFDSAQHSYTYELTCIRLLTLQVRPQPIKKRRAGCKILSLAVELLVIVSCLNIELEFFSKNVVSDNMAIHQRKTIGTRTFWE